MKMTTLLVFTSMMLLLAFGCQKEGDTEKNSQAGDPNAVQQENANQAPVEQGEPIEAKVDGFAAMAEGRGTFGDKGLESIDEKAFLTEDQIALLRKSLIEMAPATGFTVDEKAGTLSGNGLPEAGVSIDLLVGKVAKYMAAKQIEFEEPMAVRMIDMMLMELSPPPPAPEPPPATSKTDPNVNSGRSKNTDAKAGEESKKPSAEGPPSQRKYTPELPFAKRIVGDWKSIREEHARISVDHDQGYFELVTLTPEGNAEWQVFVQGERTSRALYTYT